VIFYSNFTQTFEKNLENKKAALKYEEWAALFIETRVNF